MKELVCECLKYQNQKLAILDQTLLPDREVWEEISTVEEMGQAIKKLKIRGAPAIGVAAACSLALFAEGGASNDELKKAAQYLRGTRPTAVNLMMALDRVYDRVPASERTVDKIVYEAEKVFDEDVSLCRQIAENGAKLIGEGEAILTHCNAGGLATAGIGTALGIIKLAHDQGKNIKVYVDETRPLLQGGRLTAWECQKSGIPHQIICDNMASTLMKDGAITRIFVGADRVACNGDFANKIGTYNVAVSAHYHNIAFHPAAPYTTIDPDCPNGQAIPIEQRGAEEVKGVSGSFGEVRWAPRESDVFNPAFDVTPHQLVTSFVFNHGVFDSDQLGRQAHLT